MRNSCIFFKTGANSLKFTYQNYDCCEGLGNSFQQRNMGPVMYVGVAVRELDYFFIENNHKNLRSYLELITKAFDIEYTIAPKEDAELIDLSQVSNGPFKDLELLYIKINTEKGKSNKHFNVAYNAIRYIWYHNYTNMAIVATNIYNLDIIKDEMDILAIAFSFQQGTDRAILPSSSIDLDGILFFRSKEEVIADLKRDTLFNTVFWRYPVYFNPVVKIKGSFFEDAEALIEAKELFGKFASMNDVNDIPKVMLRNIALVYKDYLSMKQNYLFVKNTLDKSGLNISRDYPVLLSKDIHTLSITGVDAVGSKKKVSINLPSSVSDIPYIEKDIVKIVEDMPEKVGAKEMFA